jgi:uncharacterized protein YxeA
MKKIISIIALVLILGACTCIFTGCTLQFETTDNSVSASVDGDTTEKVDNIIDWIKVRLQRLFNTTGDADSSKYEQA